MPPVQTLSKHNIRTMKHRLLTLLALIFPFLTIAQEEAEMGLDERVNDAFMPIAVWWEGFILTPIPIAGYNIPIVLLLLVVGATFFTFYFKFPNILKFPLAIHHP